ncbi:HAD family hydrolase [Paludibacterium paludis]|nr:HAD family hydrolase [Paludibacterium paludis]
MKKNILRFNHPRTLAAGLIEEIERTGIRTVSFDVFDTLIHRRAHPNAVVWAVARWLRDRLNSQGLPIVVDSLDARNRAYSQLIAQKAEQGLDLDVSLDELVLPWVRECVGRNFEGDILLAEQLAMIECEYEQASTFCNPDFLNLVRKLKDRGIRLIYTSDMYLGARYVDRILDSCGYKGVFDAAYVSGDFALLKRSGRLFDAVLEREGLKANCLIHVGDSFVSDGERPAERGIIAFVHEFKQMVRRNLRMEYDYQRMKVDPSWMGVVAAQYAEAALGEAGSPEEGYGRRVLGPVFASFVHRLAERCKEERIERVYFVAREGYLLRQLFEQIAPAIFGDHSKKPKTYYLGISRLTTFLASTKNFSLREITAAFNNTPHYSIKTLLAPLKLEESFLFSLAQRCGINDIDAALPPFFKEWSPFHRLLEDVQLNIEIRRRSSSVFELLQRYLEQQGFFKDSRVALVDVGWSGQIQDNLYKAIKERPDCPQIFGVYLGTTLTAHWRKTPSNWMEWTHADYSHMGWFGRSAFDFVQGLEAVVRSPHGTTIGYVDTGQFVEPTYKAETDSSRQKEAKDDPMIALFQKGMHEFSIHYAQAAKMFGFTATDTMPYARMMLNRMVRFPSSEEAGWFLKINNVSDLGSSDVFSLGQQHAVSVLRPKAMLRELRQSFWRYGVAAIGRGKVSQCLYSALISIYTIPKKQQSLCEGILFNAPAPASAARIGIGEAFDAQESLLDSIEASHKTCVEIGRKQARILSLHTATSPLRLKEALLIHLTYRLVRIGCLFSGRHIPYSDALSVKGFIMRASRGYEFIRRSVHYIRNCI